MTFNEARRKLNRLEAGGPRSLSYTLAEGFEHTDGAFTTMFVHAGSASGYGRTWEQAFEELETTLAQLEPSGVVDLTEAPE